MVALLSPIYSNWFFDSLQRLPQRSGAILSSIHIVAFKSLLLPAYELSTLPVQPQPFQCFIELNVNLPSCPFPALNNDSRSVADARKPTRCNAYLSFNVFCDFTYFVMVNWFFSSCLYSYGSRISVSPYKSATPMSLLTPCKIHSSEKIKSKPLFPIHLAFCRFATRMHKLMYPLMYTLLLRNHQQPLTEKATHSVKIRAKDFNIVIKIF